MPSGPADDLDRARKVLAREVGLADEAQLAALEQLTRVAVEVTHSAASFVTLVGEHDAFFRCSTGLKPPFGGRTEAGRSVLRRLLDATGPLALEDVRVEPSLSDAWEVSLLGAVALLAVPLIVDGIPLGTLAVLDSVPRPWSRRDEAALTAVARVAIDQIGSTRAARSAALGDLEVAERALKESEARFRTLVEHAPDGIYVVQDDRIAYANPAGVVLAGASAPGELLGLPARRLIEPPYLKALRRRVVQEEPPAVSDRVEDKLARLDGAIVDVEVSAHPYLFDDRPAALLLVRDVSERKRAEDEFRRREAELRLVATQMPVLVWSTDARLRLLSSHAARADQAATGDPVGTPLRTLFGTSDPDATPLTTQRRAAEGHPGTYRIVWRDRTYDAHVEPLRGEDDQVVGTVGVAMDVSEQVHVAEQLEAAEKLTALGQVAAGVAHEMNNILGTVLSIAAALQRSRVAPSAADLDVLVSAARRGGEITGNLLGYARGGMYRRARVRLADVVARVALGVRRTSPRVRVEWSCAEGLPDVEGDEGQLETAVANVCQNAVVAMPQGGSLTITASTEEHVGRPDLGLGAGRWVRLEVRDTGEGMTEDVRRRAVEPFFTTRPPGRGVGLGLSMAYGVVRNHGGQLVVESEPGRGTTVTFHLPAAHPVAARASEPRDQPPPAPVAEGGAILVVDDDEWVRFSTSRLLEALGYEVVEASDGAAGLAAYRARGPELVAVLLDMRMPGMDGAEVLRRLVAMDPDARVILCTGYERAQVSQSLFDLGRVGFLGKPFGLEELSAQLRAFARAPRLVASAP